MNLLQQSSSLDSSHRQLCFRNGECFLCQVSNLSATDPEGVVYLSSLSPPSPLLPTTPVLRSMHYGLDVLALVSGVLPIESSVTVSLQSFSYFKMGRESLELLQTVTGRSTLQNYVWCSTNFIVDLG